MFVDSLLESPLSGHRQHASFIGSGFYFFILAGYAILAAASPWLFESNFLPTIICSCNVVLLITTAIFQQYWFYQGYYNFSQNLKQIARLPFFTAACGTGLLLLVIVWQQYLILLSVSTLLRLLVLVEVFCNGCSVGVYIGRMHYYNSLNGQPDDLKYLYSALQQSSLLEELSYNEGGRLSDQQMVLLQYQRENLHYLNEEVLRLQECLSKYERASDGSTPQVDLAHLLATRDQELRALSAEMNQVQSELRLARNLIAERDSEMQRARVTNNQYVEENERLRGILTEWSARAAKLERALETERLSNMEMQKEMALLKEGPTSNHHQPSSHRRA